MNMNSPTSDIYSIIYTFKFADGSVRKFPLKFNARTFEFLRDSKSAKPLPDWTKLEHCKCSNCPLKEKDFPHCPIAANLSDVANEYASMKSYNEMQVLVVSSERTYAKNVSLQEGLFSIFGLVMATSACPHMKFLRPLARYHLPFSTYEETIVRSIGFYLLRQFIKQKKSGKGDFNLDEMNKLYANVQEVNAGFLKRLKSFSTGDAHANSMTILDSFVQMLNFDAADNFANLEKYLPEE